MLILWPGRCQRYLILLSFEVIILYSWSEKWEIFITARSISEEFSSGDTARFRETDDVSHARDRDKQKEKDDRDEGELLPLLPQAYRDSTRNFTVCSGSGESLWRQQLSPKKNLSHHRGFSNGAVGPGADAIFKGLPYHQGCGSLLRNGLVRAGRNRTARRVPNHEPASKGGEKACHFPSVSVSCLRSF